MTNDNDNEDNKKNQKIIDHNFDGITELDNPVPTWFRVIFYGTIIFSAVYMLYYHVYKDGNELKNEYLSSIGQSSPQNTSSDDFNYIQNLSNKKLIADGKKVYDSNCASCHGFNGQGGVGPNLTDDYWLVENTYKSVENIISVGASEKGMPGWKTILGDVKIRNIVLYISSIQGTNPENSKKPEGKLGKLH